MKNSSEKRQPRTRRSIIRDLTIEEIANAWATRQLLRFTRETFPEYRPGWFHRLVAEAAGQFLVDVAQKRSPRLILTAPPQHGKSELISRRLPAFALGRNPDLKIIATSYSADRALDFSADVQRIIDSERYHEIFPETRIVGQFAKAGEAKRSAGLFEVVGHRGRYRAAGVGGGITGEPADILIIDDPIKDFSEAMSDTIREGVYNWLTSTALTRLQEGGGVIIMATRWHMDDSIGRLLERQPDRWKLINFRAIAEADEPPYRLAGEPLSVERYSLQSLIEVRDGGAMSSYQWAALFQQRPSPVGGGIFKRDDWQWYKQPPDTFDQILQSWDCAFKDTDGSDYVCGGVIGVKGPHKYVLDVINQRLTFQGTKNAIKTMSGKWPDAWQKLVEDKANGTAVMNDLRDEVSGLIAIEPEGGKIARAHAISGEVEAHNVFLPDPTVLDAPWVHDFVEQCAGFPTAAHDDQVDMLTQALAYIRKHSWGLFVLWKQQAESINARFKGAGASRSDALADAQKYESRFAISRINNVPSCRPPAPKHKIERCPQCGDSNLASYGELLICNPCRWSNKE